MFSSVSVVYNSQTKAKLLFPPMLFPLFPLDVAVVCAHLGDFHNGKSSYFSFW